jgi:hypothetical protein
VPLTTLGWLHQRLPCQHVVEHLERTAIRSALDQSVSWNDQRRRPLSPSEAIATGSFDMDEIQVVIADSVPHQRAILAASGALELESKRFQVIE